jgi:hypothetical protein
MRVTVFVERLDERRYRASTSHPITMESEGSSRDEAVDRLRDQAAQIHWTSSPLRIVAKAASRTNLARLVLKATMMNSC